MMGMPPTLPAAMGQPATQCTGTVLRWCGSYGFIKPDDGAGEDLFCHFSSIKDGNMLKEGAPVTFVRRVDERKGREQAFDVTGGFSGVDGGFGGFRRGGSGGTGGVTGPPPPGKQQGTVSRWTAKGFGFISPDDGSEDLFCHFSKIEDGNALEPGTVVHFAKAFDEARGNHRAVSVTGGFREAPRDRFGQGGGGGYGGGGYGGGNNGSNSSNANKSSGAEGWEDRSYGNSSDNSEYENGRSRRKRGVSNESNASNETN